MSISRYHSFRGFLCVECSWKLFSMQNLHLKDNSNYSENEYIKVYQTKSYSCPSFRKRTRFILFYFASNLKSDIVKTIATLPSVLYVIFFKNDIGNPSINIGKFLKISDNLTLNIQAFFLLL